eukprot:m.145437 g.145437  ORF g.145437 m.145437 type:complete len:199 (+) comp17734_c0_seq3:123-719(+)
MKSHTLSIITATAMLSAVLVHAHLQDIVQTISHQPLTKGLGAAPISLGCREAVGRLDGFPYYEELAQRWFQTNGDLMSAMSAKECQKQINATSHICSFTMNYSTVQPILLAYEHAAKGAGVPVAFCGLTYRLDVTSPFGELTIQEINTSLIAIPFMNCSGADLQNYVTQLGQTCKQSNSTIDSCDISVTPGNMNCPSL